MSRILTLLSVVVLPGALVAQTFAEGVAKAQTEIDAKRWESALQVLLGLEPWAKEEGELQQLAALLDPVGGGLQVAFVLDRALQAHSALLAVQRRRHGEIDHEDVAESLNRVGYCLETMSRALEALPHHEAALAMRKSLHGDGDHAAVEQSMSNVGTCLYSLGRLDEALVHLEASQAMLSRLAGDRDPAKQAGSLRNVATCLFSLGRVDEALTRFEGVLSMLKRQSGDRDHRQVAYTMMDVGMCLQELGRFGDALPLLEAASTMFERLHPDRDHPDRARGLRAVAFCLLSSGRAEAAMKHYEVSLAMQQRLHGDRDHLDVVLGLEGIAACLQAAGRLGEALPRFEAALAQAQRLFGHMDQALLARCRNNVAGCLEAFGRFDEALRHYELALAVQQRLYRHSEHLDVAHAMSNVGCCLTSMRRVAEAVPLAEASLAMQRRLHGERDHPSVAVCLNNLASGFWTLGRHDESRALIEEALAMTRRLHGGKDHPDVAHCLSQVASCLFLLGRPEESVPGLTEALAMRKRLYGDSDTKELSVSLNNMAYALAAMNRQAEALPFSRSAVAMIERLRDGTRAASTMRQSLFDDLKRFGAFEKLQVLTAQLGSAGESLQVAERNRGRDMLDLLARQQFDAFEEGALLAKRRGDDATAARLPLLRQELGAVRLESDRLLHQLTRLDDARLGETDREVRRQELLKQSTEVGSRHRQLLDEHARLLGDLLPVGRACTVAEIQQVLRAEELFLEFTVTKEASLLYVLGREGEVQILVLPTAAVAAERALPALLSITSHSSLAEQRGRDPEAGSQGDDVAARSRELFHALIPTDVWPRIQASKRVFVAAHRSLHRLPFELLVTDSKDGKPVHWLENGPPISYVPSGSVLHWLRKRTRERLRADAPLNMVAVGDPSLAEAAPSLPEHGVLVRDVNKDGEGARVGLQSLDVLLSYDGKVLADDSTLKEVRLATDAAIKDGTRAATPIAIEVWRRGEALRVEVKPGPLGIKVGQGAARGALEVSADMTTDPEHFIRKSDLERLARLPQLRGARAEAEAIAAAFRGKEHTAELLIGDRATETAITDIAAGATHLHFACHGIAEEYGNQSLSMLVLAQPKNVLHGDDGLLKLADMLHTWRGRLSSCRLVVLSACRTNVGPTFRDDAPQALPIGFLFAGAPAVVSSLWAVDDESTRILMTDFYGRLLAGEIDQLAAFTAAKQALRSNPKFADPFHWAPFLYIGSPE